MIGHLTKKGVLLMLFVVLFSLISHAQTNSRKLNFIKADSVAALYAGHSLTDLYSLVNHLTSPFTNEVEKFRAIYSWVCLNIENDYILFLKNQKKREKLYDQPVALSEWNKNFSKKVFATLLKEKKTVCTGYAYLIKEMATYANIPCEIVDGYGRTIYANTEEPGRPNHTWNAVRLNGEWYLCDPTWSSGIIQIKGNTASFKQNYDTNYFLTNPRLFITNHYPLDTKWLLVEDSPSLKMFLNSPVIYRGAFQYEAIPISPKIFSIDVKKGRSIKFCFDLPNQKVVDKVLIKLDKGSSSFLVQANAYRDIKNNFCLDYTFNRKGKFVLHILFDGISIASYKVNVTR